MDVDSVSVSSSEEEEIGILRTEEPRVHPVPLPRRRACTPQPALAISQQDSEVGVQVSDHVPSDHADEISSHSEAEHEEVDNLQLQDE